MEKQQKAEARLKADNDDRKQREQVEIAKGGD
jgi:hypothetical protein